MEEDYDHTKERASEESTVLVAIRIRPFNKREMRSQAKCALKVEGNVTTIYHPSAISADSKVMDVSKGHSFPFDHSYWSFDASTGGPQITQEHIFNDLGTIVLRNAFQGYNCTLLAYGQTGSGKTYSMMGEPDDQGIIPRVCQNLFSRAAAAGEQDTSTTYKVEVSYLEIYSEQIRDLLNPKNKRSNGGKLRVREHPQTGPYVEDLTVCAVNDYRALEQLMHMGNKERTVAATNMNATSSRSHAVFSIIFTATRFDDVTNMSTDRVSKIQLVDLAGSERVELSGVTGQQLKEAANINKSLTTLGRVISALADNANAAPVSSASGSAHDGMSSDEKTKRFNAAKQRRIRNKKPTIMRGGGFVPFRDSVLTWLLKDSLGGNSKTIMIAALSPADINYDETLSTLRYASRAKTIVNKATVNEDPNARIIRALRQEIDDLRKELSGKGTQISDDEVRYLEEQLNQSKKIISDINRSWEEKLEETRQMHLERISELEQQGVMTVKLEDDVPYLVNLNEDPGLSESLVYYIRPGIVHVGSQSAVENAIVLRGLGIRDEHCQLKNDDNQTVSIEPSAHQRGLDSFAEIYVNGELLMKRRTLVHGDRVILGQHHVFRFNHRAKRQQAVASSKEKRHSIMATSAAGALWTSPTSHGRSRSLTGPLEVFNRSNSVPNFHVNQISQKNDTLDWEFATRERTVTQGKLSHLVGDDHQSEEQQRLLKERVDALEREKTKSGRLLQQQQDQYAALLEKFNEQQIDSGVEEGDQDEKKRKGAPASIHTVDANAEDDVEEIIKAHHEHMRTMLNDDLLHVIPLVDEANAICAALGQPIKFEVELITFSLHENDSPKKKKKKGGLKQKPRHRKNKHSLTWQLPVGSSGAARQLSPLQRLRELKETVVQIKVMWGRDSQERSRSRASDLSQDEFEEKLFGLRDMYNAANANGSVDMSFLQPTIQAQLIGKANIYLAPLKYGVGVQQRIQVLDHRGDFAGLVTVQIYCNNEDISDVGMETETEAESPNSSRSEAKLQRTSSHLSGALGRDQLMRLSSTPQRQKLQGIGVGVAVVKDPDDDGDDNDNEESRKRSVSVPTQPRIHASPSLDSLMAHNPKMAGRIRLRHEIVSHIPQRHEHLPIVLRISVADNLPSIGIRDVWLKYKFWNSPEKFTTHTCPVLGDEHSDARVQRRIHTKLTEPVDIDYVMRHDVEDVTSDFLHYLETDAISFEVWGNFSTGTGASGSSDDVCDAATETMAQGETVVRHVNFLEDEDATSSRVDGANTTTTTGGKNAGDDDDASPYKKMTEKRRSSFVAATNAEAPQALVVEEEAEIKDDDIRVRRRRRHTIQQERQRIQVADGKKENIVYCAVDVQEMDGGGKFNPCLMKANTTAKELEPKSVFRVTAGSSRAKRFVISLIQADGAEFALESAASTRVTCIEGLDFSGEATDASEHPGGGVVIVETLSNEDDPGMPLPLQVWEQHYQSHNKLVTITSRWTPDMLTKPLLQNLTPPGQRIVIHLEIEVYLSKRTEPIILRPQIYVKCYHPDKAVSKVRTFFRGAHSSEGRLHRIGGYVRIREEFVREGLASLFEQHQAQLQKLEHNMRIEQVSQILMLCKILKAHQSEYQSEAHRLLKSLLHEQEEKNHQRRDSALSSASSATTRTPAHAEGSAIRLVVEQLPARKVVIMRGFLQKRGKFNASWKKRWFVLQPPHLFYYKRASDTTEKGVIDLVGATVHLPNATSAVKDPYSFELHNLTRCWYLQASNQNDMDKWIDCCLEFRQ